MGLQGRENIRIASLGNTTWRCLVVVNPCLRQYFLHSIWIWSVSYLWESCRFQNAVERVSWHWFPADLSTTRKAWEIVGPDYPRMKSSVKVKNEAVANQCAACRLGLVGGLVGCCEASRRLELYSSTFSLHLDPAKRSMWSVIADIFTAPSLI